MTTPWGQVLTALLISTALLFCSAFVRKLVRGNGFELRDFYLASDIILAALATEIIFTLQDPRASSGELLSSNEANAIAMAATLTVLFVVISAHQTYEGKPLAPNTPLMKNPRFWILAVACNAAAVLVLGTSVFVAYGSIQ